ncbi:mannose-6-phosphate isomerase [Xylariales sp. PMI_506]|nr:mannose-6-phosphate isomerase [Xylariales sp. PMI_506]
MASVPRVFQLSGTCNNYPWGKKGRHSLAARLCEKTPPRGFKIDDDKPYSEMWFGDYPDFPGIVTNTGETLGDCLKKNKNELLGKRVVDNLDAQLPFLPKVLSIAKALPLQIHPNKELSEKLHNNQPDKFTDSNHKPEIAIALSKFEVFAGWKSVSDVSPLFNNVSALSQFVPPHTTEWTDDTMKSVVQGILKADEETVKKAEQELAMLSHHDLQGLASQGYIADLLPRLRGDYGSTDPGTLVALLCMNFLVLERGEALYIPADGIHAYLSGDIIECMARSNNVLNTGFCPAADRDNADLFTETLTFGPDIKGDVTLPKEKIDIGLKGRTSVYRPPIREFDMVRIDLESGEDEDIQGLEGPSVAIVTSGAGTLSGDGTETSIGEGSIFFIGPTVQTTWKANSGLQIYMATVPPT